MAFKVPTIFSAVDKFSGPVKGMGSSLDSFALKSEAAISRSERAFRKLTPTLGTTSKDILSVAKSVVTASAIIGTAKFGLDALKNYDDALASFRTIVSDLSDSDFSKFENKIKEVGNTTGASVIDVASSFEKISGLNAKFAETADGLGQVSKAAIILSQASRMELGASAESLVGIMNQFSLGAQDANRTINVLAAGQAVGAANIKQTADAFVNFGSVAAGANISLEQSVGLIQTLGKFSLFGAEAGTKLRGSILKLQQAGMGYKSGQFQINDALEQARGKIDRLRTAKEKDAALNKIFGAENISTGRILLSNVETYKQFAKGVTDTQEAQKAAAINMATFSSMVERLKNKFVNWITTSEEAKETLSILKSGIRFVSDNMTTLIKIGGGLVGFFIAWKSALWLGRAALIAYNIIQGITIALQGGSALAFEAGTIGYYAYRAATVTATAAQWLLNAALTANPIGLIIVGIAALIALVVVIIKYWNEWGAALSLFLGPLGLVISLVQAFRRNWDMISKAFSEGGILSGLKAIGKTLMDAVLMPLQQILSLIAKFTGFEWATNAANGIAKFREKTGSDSGLDESGNPMPGKAVVDTRATQHNAVVEKLEQTNNAKVGIDITDRTKDRVSVSNPMGVKINTTSTMPAY